MKTPLETMIFFLHKRVEAAKRRNGTLLQVRVVTMEGILHYLRNLQQAQSSTHPFNRMRR